MQGDKMEEEPKIKKFVDAADGLSLGISMVVAVLMGIGIGIGLQKLTGVLWTLWIGVFIGIGAAISNIHKAYKKQKKSLDELANDPRYKYKAKIQDDEDEDDKY
jgi:ATP synthase protein I